MEGKIKKLLKELYLYFGALPIGSYIFYREGLLKFEDLNDIDVIVSPLKRDGLANFLKSMGYSETIKNGKQIGYENGRCQYEIIPLGDFKKTREINIDVIVGDNEPFNVYSIPELVKEKLERSYPKDIKTLCIVMNNLKLKLNK